MSRVVATKWLRYNASMNLLVTLLTLASWALWADVVLTVDPGTPSASIAFYGSLFVALTGTLSRLLSGSASRGDEAGMSSQIANLGHAAVVSVLILFALWLQSLGMLTALNGTLLAATLLLIELGYMLSGGRRKPRARRRSRRAASQGAGSTVEQ